MKAWKFGLVAISMAVGVCTSLAEFDGPAPVAWRWAQPTSASPSGAPLVSGNVVYAAVGGRIYALDRATGNQVWRFPVAEPIEAQFRTGAAMSGGVIVAAADNRTLYAVDSATGTLKWQWQSQENIASAPVIAGNHVVIGTMPGGVMSVNLTTGMQEWKESLKLKGTPYPNLAVWQDNVIAVTNEPSVVSVNPGTAKLNWSVAAGSLSAGAKPAVFGDYIYVNTGYYLTSLRAQSGGKRWDMRFDEQLAFGPAASDNGIAVVSNSGTVYSLDTQGKFIFKKGIKLGSAPVSSPSYVGKLVSVGTTNGSLNVVDPKSGEMVYNYVVPPLFKGAKVEGADNKTNEIKYVTVAGPAAISGDTMLVLARDGSMLAFDKNLGVDLTAPDVTMIWPNAGDQLSGQPPLEIWFKLEDASSGINPDTVRVKVNGEEYGSTYTKDGYLRIVISATGMNKPLADGRSTLIVSCSDWMGNHIDAPFYLSVDNTLPATGAPPKRDDKNEGGGGPGTPSGGKGGGR